jgi:hypothetical protein
VALPGFERVVHGWSVAHGTSSRRH